MELWSPSYYQAFMLNPSTDVERQERAKGPHLGGVTGGLQVKKEACLIWDDNPSEGVVIYEA